jgi:hypothetical protein
LLLTPTWDLHEIFSPPLTPWADFSWFIVFVISRIWHCAVPNGCGLILWWISCLWGIHADELLFSSSARQIWEWPDKDRNPVEAKEGYAGKELWFHLHLHDSHRFNMDYFLTRRTNVAFHDSCKHWHSDMTND